MARMEDRHSVWRDPALERRPAVGQACRNAAFSVKWTGEGDLGHRQQGTDADGGEHKGAHGYLPQANRCTYVAWGG